MQLAFALLVITTFSVEKVMGSSHHGPTALPVVLQDGYLADTHEVAAAKNAHLATLTQQSHGGSYGESHGDLKYNGPTALPVVLYNGYLADTHEVAAAKNAHLATLTQQSHGGSYGESHGDLKYNGPTALPVVLHNGYLADTHEVAAAKNAHLATLTQQSHGGSYGESHGDLKYNDPTTLPVVLHNGYLADTHEVAAAKNAHLATLTQQSHGGSYGGNHHDDLQYHGPTAIPYVLHDGHIADTHEVTAAKAAHLSAVSKARATAGYHHGDNYDSHYATGHHGYSGNHEFPSPSNYRGHTAKPTVLPSGYLADTHEVAIAKQHHLQVLQSSQSVHRYGIHQ